MAMYAAKDAGRNAYRFFTADMNARVQLRLQLETDMRRGLMDDEFFLVYQPQIEMQTGRACGVEALPDLDFRILTAPAQPLLQNLR